MEVLQSLRTRQSRQIERVLIDTQASLELAMKDLRQHFVLGFDVEGTNLGRDGRVCLVQIATEEMCYLFDILALGNRAFDGGLRDILVSRSVLKILHDCRKDSDALFHEYDVRLANIFDTQVVDQLIRRNMAASMPPFVAGLATCLDQYLNFPESKLRFKESARELFRADADVWARRPIPDILLDYAACDVAFLHDLREAMLATLTLELDVAFDRYLRFVRDGSATMASESGSAHAIPELFGGHCLRFRNSHHRQFVDRRAPSLRANASNSPVGPADSGSAPVANGTLPPVGRDFLGRSAQHISRMNGGADKPRTKKHPVGPPRKLLTRLPPRIRRLKAHLSKTHRPQDRRTIKNGSHHRNPAASEP